MDVTPLDRKRRTGRTTRMLEAALAAVKAGRAVYVLVATENDRARLVSDPRYRDSGLRIESWATLEPDIVVDREVRLRGAHRNCVLFVDHHAIEYKYKALLDVWTRFDAPPQETA